MYNTRSGIPSTPASVCHAPQNSPNQPTEWAAALYAPYSFINRRVSLISRRIFHVLYTHMAGGKWVVGSCGAGAEGRFSTL